MRRTTRIAPLLTGLALLSPIGCAGETATLTMMPRVTPLRPLPEDIKVIAVIPMPEVTEQSNQPAENPMDQWGQANAEWSNAMRIWGPQMQKSLQRQLGGGAGNSETTTDRSRVAADVLRTALQVEAHKQGLKIVVFDPATSKDRVANDLRAQFGEIQDTLMQRIKDRSADATIYVRASAQKAVEFRSRKDFDWDIRPSTIPIGIQRREFNAISRIITVVSTYTMTFEGDGAVVVSEPFVEVRRDEHKKSHDCTESHCLKPADSVIISAVQQHARRFLGSFIACSLPAETLVVKSSSGKSCRNGVKLLATSQFESALAELKSAVSQDPQDHRAYFALGAACEKLGRFDEAADAYRTAHQIAGNDQKYDSRYASSVQRGEMLANQGIRMEHIGTPVAAANRPQVMDKPSAPQNPTAVLDAQVATAPGLEGRMNGISRVSPDDAILDAQKRAVEAAGQSAFPDKWSDVRGVPLYGAFLISMVSDPHLFKDSQARQTKVAARRGDASEVEITYEVDRGLLEAAIRFALDSRGTVGPQRVMVFADDYDNPPRPPTGTHEDITGKKAEEWASFKMDKSWTGQQVQRVLQEAGFEVRIQSAFEALRDAGAASAKDDRRFDAFRRAAGDFGAPIYIEINSIAHSTNVDFQGKPVLKWKVNTQADVRWSDSGIAVTTAPRISDEYSSRFDGTDAAEIAMSEAGVKLGRQLACDIYRELMKKAATGATFLVEVDGLSTKQSYEFADAVKALPRVESAVKSHSAGAAAQFTLAAKLPQQDLERMIAADLSFKTFQLEVVESQGATLKFRARPRERD